MGDRRGKTDKWIILGFIILVVFAVGMSVLYQLNR